LGYPLHNVRWSWGSESDRGSILLRTWSKDLDVKTKTVGVLGPSAQYRKLKSTGGVPERIRHVRALWAGGIAGYTVLVNAVDDNAEDSVIRDFRDDAVFAIERLRELPDGGIGAALGDLVRVTELRKHAETHRTHAANGRLQIDQGAI